LAFRRKLRQFVAASCLVTLSKKTTAATLDT
jgi:hypothetical protein